MPSLDVRAYVDLSLLDKDVQDVIDTALADAVAKLPDWTPREGNAEVVLMEAMALEVAELIFAINRLPGAITEVLLRLYGLDRDAGEGPVATVRFHLSDNLGHTIPAGTRMRLSLGGAADPMEFETDVGLVVGVGDVTGVVAATGLTFTTAANGVAAGTDMSMLDAIPYVNSVELETSPAGGRLPEDTAGFLERGAQLLSRLISTLVLPAHFTATALENAAVERATTIDDLDATNLLSADEASLEATIGGWVAVVNSAVARAAAGPALDGAASLQMTATAGGDASARTASGLNGRRCIEGQVYSFSLNSRPNTTLRSFRVAVDWYDEAGAFLSANEGGNVAEAGGIFTQATLLNIAAPANAHRFALRYIVVAAGAGEIHFYDAGQVEEGAVVTTYSRPGAAGDHPGHVTVAVAGPGGVALPQATKDAIDADLESKAQANLAVHVVNPTITTVAVTTTVKKVPGGFDDATVEANVEAALTEYLNPDTWAWGATVRRFELISVIDQAAGVDYVVDVTVPAADVALEGFAPLADAGVLIVVAT